MMMALECPAQEMSGITFSETVTTIYQEHMRSVVSSAELHNCSQSPVAQLYKKMAEVPMAHLFQETLPKVLDICRQESVKDAFDKAHHYQKGKDVQQRIDLWKKLVVCMEIRRKELRSSHLPGMWLPEAAGTDNERKFVTRNKYINLDEEQRAWIIADKVTAFVPFVWIEQYDPEVFNVFLQARETCS